MTTAVEQLEKLERKMTLNVPLDTFKVAVAERLKNIAKTTKIDGFRPGKVPFTIIQKRYGLAVEQEVMNDKVGQVFAQAAAQNNLRIAGHPTITEKKDASEGSLSFDAVFEVFPEVKFDDLANLSLEKFTCSADESAVEKTLDILQKQRRAFNQRALGSTVTKGDRVKVNFEGKIDGELFEGGKAEDFKFIVGEGQMLVEFEKAVEGMKVGESITFPLMFPENYHGKEVAGKTADFMVTVRDIEEAHLPELSDAFAKSLGVENATLEGLRTDIITNLEREIKARLIELNKKAVFDALLTRAHLDLPQVLVLAEMECLSEEMLENLKKRGMKDVPPMDKELFRENAEHRVRLVLVLSEFIKTNHLEATADQISTRLKEITSSYEDPEGALAWYSSDKKRMIEVENSTIENNVIEHVLGQAQITEKPISFDELMGQPNR